MNNKYCEPGTHKYGTWKIINIDGKEVAIRECNCGYKEKLPPDYSIKKEIKKQDEASIFLKAFQKITPEDENTIDYTIIMLEEYLNFLSKEQAKTLFLKIKSTIIDTKNQELIEELEKTYFNNFETFQDILELFISNNKIQSKKQTH